jgi:hypothetical protein
VRVKLPSRVDSTEVAAEEPKEGAGAELGLVVGDAEVDASGMASRETWAKRAGWLVSEQKTWPMTVPVESGAEVWVCARAFVVRRNSSGHMRMCGVSALRMR